MKFEYKKTFERMKQVLGKRHALWPTESIWMWALISFTVLNLLVLAWSFILFLRVNTGDVFAVAPVESQPTETLNRAELKELLDELEQRRVEFNALQGEAVLQAPASEQPESEEAPADTADEE